MTGEFPLIANERYGFVASGAAYAQLAGSGPGIVFLPGYNSDMQGRKAQALLEYCAGKGIGFTRVDYRGHGTGGGKFEDCVLGDWLNDALAVIDEQTSGPQILVGSSMGGWLMLRIAQLRAARLHTLIGLAPAPDFTLDLFERDLNAVEQAELLSKGVVRKPSDFGGEYLITKKLVDEAHLHFVLKTLPSIHVPLHIIHGCQDTEVPWQQSVKMLEDYGTKEVSLTLIKDGDHRLSRDSDLQILFDLLERIYPV